MKSHTFGMADNKQLKDVIRGLPTDYDQKEIASEFKGFGFEPNHISILRNRKTNTNVPLFLEHKEENKQIFHITNIGFFCVIVEPLKGSLMPPQCYRCQEFYHHSRLCNKAPKCLKCSCNHLTAECNKSTKSPAKCANCGGPHQANFSGSAILLTGNNIKNNQTTTSVRRRPRHALRSSHHTNSSRLMLRQWLKIHLRIKTTLSMPSLSCKKWYL
ncbi:nucleic-acid-binding protein from transposon X-element [Trichonephila clavipes]|nr:nucleic-acid-binding protein from transposon X-element [Trichonephila clavipes]